MTEDFKGFPKFDEVQRSIEKFKKLGFPKFNKDGKVVEYVKQISDLLTQEFQVLPNILTVFKPKSFNLKIFRVRELDSFTNINLFSEHSYPPINAVGFGRCNFPKFPVFYCSNDAMTALLEVVKENGDKKKKYCISKWEIIDSKNDLAFQSFLQSDLAEENHFNALKEGVQKKINEPFENKLNKDQEKGLLEYLKFLDSSFISDNEYSLSACLAHRALYSKHNFSTDILMYPSIQTRFKGVNMAIHPNFINNHTRIKRFYIVEFEHYNPDKGKIKINLTKYGDIQKNVIMWKNIFPDDLTYQEYMKEDFGHLMTDNFKFEFNKK